MRIIFLGLSLCLIGCATTLEKRKAEKKSSYQALAPEIRGLVDKGIIHEGISEDAVYVAWGKPAEILEIKTQSGHITKWLFKKTYFQEHSYWTFRSETPRIDYYGRAEGSIRSRRLEKTFEPHDYVSAEVDFVNGVVKNWRQRPTPR